MQHKNAQTPLKDEARVFVSHMALQDPDWAWEVIERTADKYEATPWTFYAYEGSGLLEGLAFAYPSAHPGALPL